MEYVAGFVIGFIFRPVFDVVVKIVDNAWKAASREGEK